MRAKSARHATLVFISAPGLSPASVIGAEYQGNGPAPQPEYPLHAPEHETDQETGNNSADNNRIRKLECVARTNRQDREDLTLTDWEKSVSAFR